MFILYLLCILSSFIVKVEQTALRVAGFGTRSRSGRPAEWREKNVVRNHKQKVIAVVKTAPLHGSLLISKTVHGVQGDSAERYSTNSKKQCNMRQA